MTKLKIIQRPNLQIRQDDNLGRDDNLITRPSMDTKMDNNLRQINCKTRDESEMLSRPKMGLSFIFKNLARKDTRLPFPLKELVVTK